MLSTGYSSGVVVTDNFVITRNKAQVQARMEPPQIAGRPNVRIWVVLLKNIVGSK